MKKTNFYIIAFFVLSGFSKCYCQIWKNSIDDAIKEASVSNKKILLFFSVSEQCDNCISLEQNIFRSDAFLAFATAHYILVKIDFSQKAQTDTEAKAEQNLLIIEKYNRDGFFPLVVILNKDSRVLGKTGIYKNETPKEFIKLLEKF